MASGKPENRPRDTRKTTTKNWYDWIRWSKKIEIGREKESQKRKNVSAALEEGAKPVVNTGNSVKDS